MSDNILNDHRPSWTETFIDSTYSIARRSPDPNTKVGAVLVRDNIEIMKGYNGLCRGIDHLPSRLSREGGAKYKWIEHAERNAIFNCAREGISTKGTTLYLPFLPCEVCARSIIQAGISRVCVHAEGQAAYVYTLNKIGRSTQEYWDNSLEMLNEAGIFVDYAFTYVTHDAYLDNHIVKFHKIIDSVSIDIIKDEPWIDDYVEEHLSFNKESMTFIGHKTGAKIKVPY